jgi:small-conductance mechanosensitive channel
MIAVLAEFRFRSMFPEGEELVAMGVRIAFAIVAGFVIQRLLFLLAARIEHWIRKLGNQSAHAQQRALTLGSMLRNLITVLVVAGVVIRILAVLGWNVQPLLAGAGILGVALGFGAQSLVRDVIAGVFIIAEDQFGVGDLVEFQGRIATVEDLTVRSATLRDFNGHQLFVPNGELRIVVNRSRGWSRLAVDVPIPAGQDVDRALQLCSQVADAMNADPEWRGRLLDDIDVWGVETLGPADAVIRLVVRAQPGPHAPEVAREVRRRVHHALTSAGIRAAPVLGPAPPAIETPPLQPLTTRPD